HVGIGKEIPMHSDGPRLERGDASKGFGIFRFAGSSKSHRMGKDGGAIQTHGHAALEICRDNEGQLRRSLQPVEQLGGNIGLAFEQNGAIHRDGHDQRSDVVFADDILRNVLSTHFWPALSTWMGPACRKRSLLLSLAKQSAAASRSVIGSRCRSMQLTIAKTDGNVLQPSHGLYRICRSTVATPSAWMAASSPNPASQCTSGSRRNHVIWRLA